MEQVRSLVRDASGAVADLGVLLPIAAALIVRNGLDAGTVLVGAGLLYLAAGSYFRVPFPVQPIKAAAAIAIARHLAPETLAAAGLCLGVILLVLAVTGLASALSRIFTPPIVRGVQVGVGLILVRGALHLPKGGGTTGTYVLAAAVALALTVGATRRRWPVALAIVGAGVAASLLAGKSVALHAALWHPSIAGHAFHPDVLWSALVLLVIPQVPLTFGNAVVALTELEHEYFGERGRRVTPRAVSLSCGLANVAAGTLGGMPMCHGSGGLTAHYRAGARTRTMNLLIGVPLLAIGLVFGPAALAVIGLVPVGVLMGFLAFTGVFHALLVADQRGYDLFIALAMGVVGWATSNLATALGVGLILHWAPLGVRGAVRARFSSA